MEPAGSFLKALKVASVELRLSVTEIAVQLDMEL